MGSPRRWARRFAGVWAVLQFALSTAVLWGDAALARDTRDRHVVHIETTANRDCRPVHPDECALCQFVSNSMASVPRATERVEVAQVTAAPASEAPRLLALPARGIPASRAPPAV